jgi:hypothetical protein
MIDAMQIPLYLRAAKFVRVAAEHSGAVLVNPCALPALPALVPSREARGE